MELSRYSAEHSLLQIAGIMSLIVYFFIILSLIFLIFIAKNVLISFSCRSNRSSDSSVIRMNIFDIRSLEEINMSVKKQ